MQLGEYLKKKKEAQAHSRKLECGLYSLSLGM